jgi:hypothetical protein
VALCFAADPNLGTWKLNESKSQFDPTLPRTITVAYEADNDNVKATLDGVDGQGKPIHSVWTGKFDGEDYAVTGDPNADTRSIKKVNDHTLELTIRKRGKVTFTGQIVISADGKTRTLTTSRRKCEGRVGSQHFRLRQARPKAFLCLQRVTSVTRTSLPALNTCQLARTPRPPCVMKWPRDVKSCWARIREFGYEPIGLKGRHVAMGESRLRALGARVHARDYMPMSAS